MHVELLVIDNCPNEGRAAEVLRRALDDVGLSRVPIHRVVVSTQQDADRLRFVGSPTIRVNGEDAFGLSTGRFALACRVYQSDLGSSGVPDLPELRRVLKRHAEASFGAHAV